MTSHAREIRRQIRQWRRGRADTTLAEAISNAYIAILATLMGGAGLVSLLVQTGAVSAHACTSGACESARFWGPWIVTLGGVAAAGIVAQLFGPVFVSAATASWVLATPVPRRSFLLRPFVMIAVIASGLAAAAALISTSLAGFGIAAILVATAATALLGIALVALWATVQPAESPRLSTALVWLPGIVLELLLVLAWHGNLRPRDVPAHVETLGCGLLAGVGALSVLLILTALRRLDLIRNRDLTAGGKLSAALSGALAALDLALVYDVVTAQRWRRRGHARSWRGGPRGIGAVIWLDIVRARRSPSRLLLLLAAVPIPYAARALGAGPATAVIAVLAGFLAALPLMIGTRVLARTPGLTRMLPFPSSQARAAALVIPACCLLGYGLLTMVASANPVPVGLAALAASTRLVAARPPNYSRPLVPTPLGAVPTNLYGSVFRGFDVVLLTALPLLVHGNRGALISMALSAVVLLVLVSRQPGP